MKKNLTLLMAAAVMMLSCGCSEKNGESSAEKSSHENATSGSAENSSPSEKTVVTLGTDEVGPDMVKYIADFNNSDAGCRIEIKSYSDPDSTYDDIQKAIKIDVGLGKAPDMLLLSENSLYDILASKGSFADISGIYENSGILPNIKEMCTEDNGEIYRVPLGFNVLTAYTKPENGTDSCDIFSFQKMKNVMESLGDGEAFAVDMMAAEYTLKYSLINDFSDTKAHTCNFDSDEFVEALDLYRQVKFSRNETSPDGRIHFATINNAPMIDNMLRYFPDSEPLMTPPEDARMQLERCLTITSAASSEAKSGAEEFIRYVLSDECVNVKTPIWFPITESGLDMTLGIEFSTADSQNKTLYKTLEAGVIAFYKGYFSKVKLENYIDREILFIFQEETESFINGGCSASQCADMIQNRASLYLAEQS